MRRFTTPLTSTRGLSATLVVVLAVGTLTFGALAIFTDTQDVDANSFTTGTVDLSATPATALVSYSNMAPGDSVTDDVVVANDGSLALRYALTSAATDTDDKALKDQLALTVKTADATTPLTPCNDFDGDTLYSGDLDGTTGALFGDTAQGGQAGDRTLAAGASETLCFRVALPTSTGDAFQDATTTATFTFAAEQTANN